MKSRFGEDQMIAILKEINKKTSKLDLGKKSYSSAIQNLSVNFSGSANPSNISAEQKK